MLKCSNIYTYKHDAILKNKPRQSGKSEQSSALRIVAVLNQSHSFISPDFVHIW